MLLQGVPRLLILGRNADGAKAEADAKHASSAEKRYISAFPWNNETLRIMFCDFFSPVPKLFVGHSRYTHLHGNFPRLTTKTVSTLRRQ
jgi:hypothetical protein